MSCKGSGLAIGIDLGTTDSCVSVMRNNKVEIILNAQGGRTFPSFVAFTESGHVTGGPAKDQAARNARNTVYNMTRLIGRAYNNESVQSDIQLQSFAVIDENNRPVIAVDHLRFTTEEITALLLLEMRTMAETFLGETVSDAVISVPASFNFRQRESTIDAAMIAGFNAVRLINAPSAAAIAYGMENGMQKGQNVLIFDLGGGTFDVSLLTIEEGIFEVKATAGNTHLGGEDFDSRLVQYFAEEFKRKYNKDLNGNNRALRRLRTACEIVKRTLSASMTATVEIASLYDGIDLNSSITRLRFEELCADHFRDCLGPIEKVLRNAMMSKSDVDKVVLTGGSSRIPKVQQLIQQFFSGKELCKSINPDEAVAYGAAVYAAMVIGQDNDATKNTLPSLLLEVTPISLGIEAAGGVMTKIIERNSTVPCQKTQVFNLSNVPTAHDQHQHSVFIRVYEGERALVKDNNLLDNFVICGILRDNAQIEVTFDLYGNLILDVSVEDKSMHNKKKITITSRGKLTKEQIDTKKSQIYQFHQQNKNLQETTGMKDDLDQYILQLRNIISHDITGHLISSADRLKLEFELNNTCKRLESKDHVSAEFIKDRRQVLQDIAQSISLTTSLHNAAVRNVTSIST